MRPPRNAGESQFSCFFVGRDRRGFNEAPAKRGGKSRRRRDSTSCGTRFNEAPAKRGGKFPLCAMTVAPSAELQ